MKHFWQRWQTYFDARPIREKIAVAALLLAAVYSLFFVLWLAPLNAQYEKLVADSTALSRELDSLTATEKVLTDGLRHDPTAAKAKQLEALQRQLDELDQSLASLSLGLIPAPQLPVVLRDVLRQRGQLALLSLQALPAQAIALDTPSAEGKNAAQHESENDDPEQGSSSPQKTAPAAPVHLYKHSVRVRFKGRYFDVQRYLAALENSEWRFYWENLEYRVVRYPHAEVTVDVFTLSLGKGVLGG